ncbi:glycosyltransferase family 2 protein [Paenibacillus periandrae]|uniref:glycosyltransferase family 2 protein n=1 Tax=Paenibacillus periandrae TaxID=1761741 RepID=UPI001F08FEEB|nr:glycosyltransferase [Paenibacillus periandrae]
MELYKAIMYAGLCKESELDSIVVNLQISDGVRNEHAESRRYFIYKNNSPLCSVKRLPKESIFDVDLIIETQQKFNKYNNFSSPQIFGVYKNNENIFIVEEFLLNVSTVHELIINNEVTTDNAITLIEKVFNEIIQNSEEVYDENLLATELKQLDAFTKTAENFNVPQMLILRLKEQINKDLDILIQRPLLTSRDINANNILVNRENKVFLVDFDLSQKTHFWWIDIFRNDFWDDRLSLDNYKKKLSLKGLDSNFLNLLSFLNEIWIIQKVFTENHYLKNYDSYRKKILDYFKLWIANTADSEKYLELVHATDLIQLPEQIEHNYPYYSQLFWSDDNLFLEENSRKVGLVEQNDFSLFQFQIPEMSTFFRLDPSNKPCSIIIKSLSLTVDDHIIYEINHETNFEELITTNGLYQLEDTDNGFYNIVALNDDPQIIVNFPDEIKKVTSKGKINILVEMKYINDISSVIIATLEQKAAESLLLKRDLNDTKSELLQLNQNYAEINNVYIGALENLKTLVDSIKMYEDSHQINLNEKTILKGDLEESKNQLEESNNELKITKIKLEESNNELKITKIKLEEDHKELTQFKNENEVLKNTLSWKVTLPLRKFGGIIHKFKDILHIIIRKRFSFKLIPVNDLLENSEPYSWKSIGSDPYFILEGRIPTGWVKITWTSSSNVNLPLKIYWDEGQGLSETNSHIFGHLKNGKNKIQEAVMFISPLTQSLRLDTGDREADFSFESISMFKITRVNVFMKSVMNFIKQRGFSILTLRSLIKKTWAIFKNQGLKGVWIKIKYSLVGNDFDNNSIDYQTWLLALALTEDKRLDILKEIDTFHYKPLISVIVPVYNVDEEWLVKCIDSVRNQLYSNWELCIADDASPKQHIRSVLEKYEKIDERIKVVYREKNGHISEASNSALDIANGEFIALLDHDDELAVNALFENVKLLNSYHDADMIYSDEDKISMEGERHSPYFKPDWSPDTFLSHMYVCHLGVYRTSLVRQIGGFRKGYEGSQDYDLALRITEITDRVFHISKILYHWRTIPQSTASSGAAKDYTKDAGFKSLQDAIVRRGIDGWVERSEIPNVYTVHHRPTNNPKISILIPTRNMGEILDQCLISIFEKTTYQNFEVIVIDNGSDERQTLEIFEKWEIKESRKFRVHLLDIPFNYSMINNEGAKIADGELLLLLNNDIEVITPTWLEEMAGQAIRSSIGAVGATLLYPDNTIQHGGVILGIGGVADHSHKHSDINSPGYFSKLKTVNNYSAVTAACLMVRKEVFFEVGGLEEELEVAFNDIDFCLRIRNKGYNIVCLPHVQLYHHESKSRGLEDTPTKRERFYKEIAFMQDRWGDSLFNDPYYNVNLSLEHRDFRLKI